MMLPQKHISNKRATAIFALLFALIAILGLVSIITPQPGTDTGDQEAPLKTRSTYSGYLFRVVAVTITLVVFLVVGLRVYRKQVMLRGKNSLSINLLGRYYINDRQYLLKVAIDDRNLLLGVSEGSISLITELDAEAAEAPEKRSFGRILDLENNKETQV